MSNIFDDFIKFSNEQVSSKDIDPVYPLIKEVNRIEGLDLEHSIWRLLLYVTWYRLGSSEVVFTKYPDPQIINDTLIFKTGIERRGFRGNNYGVEMINDFMRKNGSIEAYIEKIRNVDGKSGWTFVREDFETVKWNGGWASYKFADLLKNVIGFNITAPNIGGEKVKEHSPVKCLHILLKEYDEEIPYEFAKDEKIQQSFYSSCKKAGATFNSLDQMETCLCDFGSLMKGNYYSGKDIDEMLQWVSELPDVWGQARLKVFDPKYLGEIGGWGDVRKEHYTNNYKNK